MPKAARPEELDAVQEEGGGAIRAGDLVRVRYLTGAGATLDVTLSNTKNDPRNGIVHVGEPLGAALLGAEQGDEVELLVGNVVRRVLVEQVTKNDEDEETNGDGAGELRATSGDSNSGSGENEQSTQFGVRRQQVTETELKIEAGLDPERFYDAEYRRVIQSRGTTLVDQLGPISFRHLSDLIARAHGFQRTGSQIKRQVWTALSKSRKSTRTPNNETVLCPEGTAPTMTIAFRGLRVNGDERGWSDVPYPEKLGLAIEIAQRGHSQDPAAAMAARIGLSRLRQVTRDELEALVVAARKVIARSATSRT